MSTPHKRGGGMNSAVALTSRLTRLTLVAASCCAASSGGCGLADDGAILLTASVSDHIGTVVTVRWRTAVAAISYLEYGDSPQLGRTTPPCATAAQEHTAQLLGLTSDTDVSFRAVWGDGAFKGDIWSITTGSLPATRPKLRTSGDGLDRFVITTLLGGERPGPVIIGPNGNYVWYYPEDRGLDVYRARLSRDGRGVYYNAASVSGDPAESSELVWVSFDGSERRALPIPMLAHDFVELEDGTLTAIVSEYREPTADGGVVGEMLRGEKLVEISPEGSQREIWSSWDCFDPQTTPGDDPALGWTFANALDYDTATDAYYLGLRNFSAIVKIDRAKGGCDWVFGRYAATVSPDAASSMFLHQHQFQLTQNSILVFDNAGAAGNEARVIEYAFDPANGIASEIWHYTAEPPRYTFVLGDVSRLDNGDTFVVWSVAGQMERVTKQKEVVWQLNSELGYAFGFATTTKTLEAASVGPDR